eukprot:365493-Chlamydomonas_euryale.AAC.6
MASVAGDDARCTIGCTKGKVHVARQDAWSSNCKLIGYVKVRNFLALPEGGRKGERARARTDKHPADHMLHQRQWLKAQPNLDVRTAGSLPAVRLLTCACSCCALYKLKAPAPWACTRPCTSRQQTAGSRQQIAGTRHRALVSHGAIHVDGAVADVYVRGGCAPRLTLAAGAAAFSVGTCAPGRAAGRTPPTRPDRSPSRADGRSRARRCGAALATLGFTFPPPSFTLARNHTSAHARSAPPALASRTPSQNARRADAYENSPEPPSNPFG